MKKLRQERNPRKVPSSTEVLLLCVSYRPSVLCPSENVSSQWLPLPTPTPSSLIICFRENIRLVRWRIHIKHRGNVLVYQHLFLSDFTWYTVSSNKPRFLLNPLNPELNPICYLLALLAHHFLHVSRIIVKSLTLRLRMSYIYGAHILDVSRSHTTTQHIR